ncbi:multidrug transporter AcrB [Lottiidibacillus patelloidae]|uniref:Multidrug transporter AcrB n=1 Tax=Lottiidibacillus patelloidae TaxID=2670334 RepID=A0A263BYJ8_9BACI|nr:efflux RND transporter permease subunit [Lottiidibacillus patelloidae]OZM58698.1 multidrug transporter AcrB [Lottiidibacillus patelloidae]
MKSATKFSLKNPVAIIILSFLFVLGGLYSFSSLKVDLLPDITFPQLSVQVVYPGASPQDVNEQVTTPVEEQLKGLQNVDTITSTSYESIAIFNLQFPFDTNMDEMEEEARRLIENANLPESTAVTINQFSFGAFPIYNISLFPKGDTDVNVLYESEILPKLKKINGLNNVTVGGTKEELLQITVDRKKATQYGISLTKIKEAINGMFLSFPAGSLEDNAVQVPVRVEQKIETIEQLKEMTFTTARGSIALSEIATVSPVTEKVAYTRYNMQDTVQIVVTKKQDANTVEVSDSVIEILESYSSELDYSIGFDQATGIKKSVNTLIKEGLFGALFASLAVLLFLRNFRATFIAILSIPLSLLASSIFLAQLGITLNIMTLGGMAVAVGRVVDDSIVVIENIFRRIRKSTGEEDRIELIVDSTKEILKAITSSTLTTIVVFLPLGLVGGITGEFFMPFALTIIVALFMSLLVSITLVPILANSSFKTVVPDESENKKLQNIYTSIMKKALNMKALVITISLVLLAGSIGIATTLDATFLPNEKQKTIVAKIELPAATSLEKTNEISLKIETLLANREDTIQDVTTGVGSRDYSTGISRKNVASYFINLTDSADIDKEIKVLEEEFQKIIFAFDKNSVISLTELQSGGPPSSNNVDIDLYSTDLDALQEAATAVEAYMNEHESLKYVTNNMQDKQKQVLVEIDPKKASAYGVSGYMVLGMIAEQTKPVSVGDLTLSGTERYVRIAYDQGPSSATELENMTIFSSNGPIALKDFASVKEVENVSAIQKLDGKIFARVSAQVYGNSLVAVSSEVVDGVKALVGEGKIPANVSLEAGSGGDETMKTFADLGLAMIVAIGLVYLTMLITFGQARIPFIILSSLIFVPIGAILGLLAVDEPLSVSAMIGVLMLIGIVTTNAIVLVDRIGQNRYEKGMKVREAVIEAGQTRLRPILMTALATIAALLPLAFTTSEGTLISKGLAVVVIGGLTTSTLLTLIIVPVLYELFYRKQIKRELELSSPEQS